MSETIKSNNFTNDLIKVGDLVWRPDWKACGVVVNIEGRNHFAQEWCRVTFPDGRSVEFAAADSLHKIA